MLYSLPVFGIFELSSIMFCFNDFHFQFVCFFLMNLLNSLSKTHHFMEKTCYVNAVYFHSIAQKQSYVFLLKRRKVSVSSVTDEK